MKAPYGAHSLRLAPGRPARTYEWIQRSADPRSNDMKILGRKGERGAEDCQISPKEDYGDIISNVGRYRREGGGGEKEIFVGGALGQVRCAEVAV